MKHVQLFEEFLNEGKLNEGLMNASKMLKIFKNKADWGDTIDQVYVKGGNLVYIDSFFYGQDKALKSLVDSWSKGGDKYKYFNDMYGIDIDIVDTFSEFKATGRHKKLTDTGIVGVVLKISGGSDTPINEAKDPVYKKGQEVLIRLTFQGGVGKFADSMSKSKTTQKARIVKRIKNKITGGYKYELSNYITVHPSEIVGLAESVNEGYHSFKGKMKKDLTLGGKMGGKFDIPKKSDMPKVTFKRGEDVELEIQPNSYHIYGKGGKHGYMDKQLAPQLRFMDIDDYVIYESVNEDSNFDYHIDTIKKAEDYLALNGMESVGEIEKIVDNYLKDRETRPDDEKLITSLEFFKNRLGEKPNPKSTKLGKYLIKNKLAESVNEKDFEPHMMYDPKTGKGYKAEKQEDHDRMDKLGYVHEKPEEVNEGSKDWSARYNDVDINLKNGYKYLKDHELENLYTAIGKALKGRTTMAKRVDVIF